MIDSRSGGIERRILGVLCILVLCGILTAGLWPFHAPMNRITWLKGANGVLIGRYGTLFSSRSVRASRDQASCSLEMWLQPARGYDRNTLLAFYRPEETKQFSLHQSDADLALQIGSPNQRLRATSAPVVYVDGIFRARNLLFIAIASGLQGTRIYVDGALLRTAPQFRLSTEDCSGRLVLGTSPVFNNAWSGQLRGLAIFGQELTADQVSRDFTSWTAKRQPGAGADERVIALYPFDERQGRTVHDRSGSGIDLTIPERYGILREKFLEPPWKEWNPGWSYWKNVGINIGGFVPLGFFFCAFLTTIRKISRPALTTVIAGAAVSLSIEVLQAYLPTRDSGMTDLITNTLGTGLGVMLFRWRGCAREILAAVLIAAVTAVSAPAAPQPAAPQKDAIPTFGTTVVVPGGLIGVIYPMTPFSTSLPDFQWLDPLGVIYTSTLNVTPRDFREGFPGVTDRYEWFAIDYSGRFWIEEPGLYRFELISDDGSKLYIDGQLVVNNDGLHPAQTRTGEFTLAGGIHRIRVSYFQGPKDRLALVLRVAGPGEEFRIFSTEEFKPPPDPATWTYVSPLLHVSPASGVRGEKVRLEISLGAGTARAPSALKWELIFPAQLLEPEGGGPEPGSAAINSGKSLECTARKPYSYTCSLSGGQNPTANGPIAIFHFKIRPTAEAGTSAVRLENAEGVTVDSKEQRLDNAEGAVTVR